MNFFSKLIGHALSFPARVKGMKFGRNSFIGPGYSIAPKLAGIELKNDVIIGRNAWFDISKYTKNAKIFIEDGTQIGRNSVVSACKKISIGRKCLISYNVTIVDHDHDIFNPEIAPMDAGIMEGKEISIGDECFIGAHSFILKGVSLGKHCIVGANSVVTKSFPDYSVVAGSPAKLIRNIKNSKTNGRENENNSIDASV